MNVTQCLVQRPARVTIGKTKVFATGGEVRARPRIVPRVRRFQTAGPFAFVGVARARNARAYNGTRIALNSTVQLHCGQQQSETVTAGPQRVVDAWPIRKTAKAKYSAFALTRELFQFVVSGTPNRGASNRELLFFIVVRFRRHGDNWFGSAPSS